MEKRKVTLIEGDGIGPEIADAVREIFAAADVPVEWERAEAGLGAIERAGAALPEATLESIRRNRVALKGPTTTPVGGGHKSVNVTIRKSLDLFANVRPARSLPGVETRFPGVDLLLFRENIEDTYSGIEHWQTPDVVQCLKVITRPGSLALIRYAFEMARSMGRRRVTCVHKANIHKMSDGLFLDCFREVAAGYSDMETDDIIVDNCCMQLVTHPERFDTLILPNLYGDIVSDLCAGLVGGLGVAPGGNVGHDRAAFEAVHGSAPDIAGQGKANPTAFLQSATLMLNYLGLMSHARRVESALFETLAAGIKTGDLGGKASTSEYTRAVIDRLPADDATDGSNAMRASDPQADASAATRAGGTQSPEFEVRGVDVFVRSAGMPDPPAAVGNLKLALMSNRGTKVFPPPAPDIYMVDWFRLRYKADAPVTDADISRLLGEIADRYTWMHVEKLHEQNGTPMYSKAQGE